IRQKGIVLTHILPKGLNHAAKMDRTTKMIARYRQKAKMVVTGRLHAALPCRGMDVPCVMMISDWDDVRWPGLMEYLVTCGPDDPWNFDVDHFAYPFNPKLRALQTSIRERVWTWVH